MDTTTQDPTCVQRLNDVLLCTEAFVSPNITFASYIQYHIASAVDTYSSFLHGRNQLKLCSISTQLGPAQFCGHGIDSLFIVLRRILIIQILLSSFAMEDVQQMLPRFILTVGWILLHSLHVCIYLAICRASKQKGVLTEQLAILCSYSSPPLSRTYQCVKILSVQELTL